MLRALALAGVEDIHLNLGHVAIFRSIVQWAKIDRESEAELFRTGIKIDGEVLDAGGPPPELGEHTDEVLAEFGLSESEVAELRNKGAI